MAKRRGSGLSTVVNFMSEEAQQRLQARFDEPRLALAEISPDPHQPRRLLPAPLAVALDAGEISPVEAIDQWLGEARADDPTLRELRALASSIEQHGLINSITVRRPAPDEPLAGTFRYLIVTGERRYWAHALLASQGRAIHEGDLVLDPAQIKVSLAAEGISVRAHQLIENLMREDINAVEKAEGMWALRCELSGVNRGSLPSAEGRAELQASGALVPWNRVEEALGISRRYRIYVTSVLQLSEDSQRMVLEYNLSERLIRPIVQKLRNHPALQVSALRQIHRWQQAESGANGPLLTSVNHLVQRLLDHGDVPAAREAPLHSVQLQRRLRALLTWLDRLDEGAWAGLQQEVERADVLGEDLETLLERLQALRPDGGGVQRTW